MITFSPGNNPVTDRYWKPEDHAAVAMAQNCSELLPIAIRVIKRLPQGDVWQVCGPISSGGTGDMEENLKLFDQTIKLLQKRGRVVFDQLYFQSKFSELYLACKTAEEKQQFTDDILNNFYLPIFKSGLIKNAYFMKKYFTSNGALWEFRTCTELNLSIIKQS